MKFNSTMTRENSGKTYNIMATQQGEYQPALHAPQSTKNFTEKRAGGFNQEFFSRDHRLELNQCH